MKAMSDIMHVRFFWQLLALRKRLDINPYSLSSDELVLLKSYETNELNITNDR